jgi:Fe-S-cluster containining protein
MKEKDFIAVYLFLDVDGHLALRSTPCSFLDPEDNTCHIYEFRPRACRDYPHTDRRRFIQIADLTLKNTSICPAAFNIVEALKKAIPV